MQKIQYDMKIITQLMSKLLNPTEKMNMIYSYNIYYKPVMRQKMNWSQLSHFSA